MKQSKLMKFAVCVFFMVAALFLVFFLFLGWNEGASTYQARSIDGLQEVQDYIESEVQDPAAPIGVRKEYRWTVDDIGEDGTTLCFYLVHQYGEVYLDGELLYSLLPRSTNIIGNSISSNWIAVPLYSGDIGKELCVVVTPVYESVRNRTVTFEMGSFYRLYERCLLDNLPILILSIFCCVLGLFIMAAHLVLLARKKAKGLDIFFLGCFTLLLGIWKVTDTRFSPFMFPNHTMLLGYLTIACLFLAGIPLSLYFTRQFSGNKTQPMLIVALAISGVALAVLFCQVFGIADLRELLPLAHISIIIMGAVFLISSLYQCLYRKTVTARQPLFFTGALLCGVVIDLFLFYITGSSSGLIFTLLTFVVYTLIQFTTSFMGISKQVYTDAQTGLFNKRRWEALMSTPNLHHVSAGIIMMDLNQLKYVNDTMGHDMGDKMILAFSNILRNTIPAANTICRWGGDEFAVLITNATDGLMAQYLSDIREAVDSYNASGEKPELQYAAGYALSEEFPEMPLEYLFKQADARMYKDKQRWYHKASINQSDRRSSTVS